MKLIKKSFNFTYFLLFGVLLSSCLEKTETTTPPAPITEVISITGGSLSIKATDSSLNLTTQEILDSSSLPVKDGTEFIVSGTAETGVSSDGTNFGLFTTVTSSSGKLSFFVKPPNQVGNYRVAVTQKQKQSRNANGFFYIDVKPADPDDLGTISTNSFRDQAPFNLVRDPSELYTVLGDGQTPTTVTVGPIVDKFGNLIDTGYVRFVSSKGAIASINPAPISAGFVNFSLIPDETTGEVSVKAQAVDEAAGRIIKETFSNILQVKPELVFSGDLEFGEAFTSVEIKKTFTLTNTGSAPVRNLQLRLIPPYSFSKSEPCPLVINPGDSCSFDVVVNSPERGDKFSELEVSAQPETISGLRFRKLMHTRYVSPPNLVLSSSELNFGQNSCGDMKEVEFFVQNTGETDAFDFTVTDPTITDPSKEAVCSVKLDSAACEQTVGCSWKQSKNKCSSNQFEIVKPPRDPSVDFEDPTLVQADCGDVIPANGIRCRLLARYYPRVLTSGILANARLSATNAVSTPITLSASSRPGKPNGEIPIVFSAQKMNLGQGNSIGVTVGPAKDACGNSAADTSQYLASVSAGSLDKTAGSFFNGIAQFVWTGVDDFSKLGQQNFSIRSNVEASKSIIFSGVSLSVSGGSDIGQIAQEEPESRTFTIVNNGNEVAENITINFETPVNVNPVVQNSSCSSVLPGGTCDFSILFQPELGASFSAGFSGKISVSSSSPGRNLTKFSFSGFANQLIKLVDGGNFNYSMGRHRAAETLTRTVSIKNNTANDITSINYEFAVGTDPGWSYSLLTCGQSLSVGQSCKIRVSYFSTTSGNKSASFSISGVGFSSIINLFDEVIGSDAASIPLAVSSEEVPADGLSEIQINAGPILDLYGNTVPAGTRIKIESEKGSILSLNELVTDELGQVYSSVRSEKNQVGFSQIKLSSVGQQNLVTGIKNVKFTGVSLEFEPASVDFGQLAMNLTKDVSVELVNRGNILAEGLVFESNNPTTYSVIGKGSCSSGVLAEGDSCSISLRFLSPISESKSDNNGSITVRSTTQTGKNLAVIPLKGVNLLPATMITEQKSISVQLVRNSFYVTKINVHNVGDDIFRNFSVSSNRPENISFSEFEGCNNLVGGGSCSITLTFSSFNLISAFSSIVSISAEGTSSQVTFTSDDIKLAFESPSFSEDVFSCNPVRIEAQDSSGNQMVLREQSSIGLSSIRELDGSLRKGQFFRTRLCTGTPISRALINQGNAVSSTVYFRPEVAGKHTITAKLNQIVAKQDSQANLTVSPGVLRVAAPREPIPFVVQGANGNVTCEFIVDPPSERKLNNGGRPSVEEQAGLTPTGSACMYISGTVGEVTDNFVIKDQDSPPNTVGIGVRTTKAIQIRPLNREAESGSQIQFFAEYGSGTGYSYRVTSEAPNKKLGSYFSNNIYNAGLNVTNSDFVRETITVKDSLGAESSTTVLVKRSNFKNEFVSDTSSSVPYTANVFVEKDLSVSPAIKGYKISQITPSAENKSVSIWRDKLAIGDPGATVDGTLRAGAVYVYKKIKKESGLYNWEKENTFVSLTPIDNGEFGKAISLFNDILVVGAPNEYIPGVTDFRVGSSYVVAISKDKVLGQNSFNRINFFRNNKIYKTTDNGLKIGSFVEISGNSILISSDIKGAQSLFNYSASEIFNSQQNKQEVSLSVALAKDRSENEIAPENDDEFTRSPSVQLSSLDFFDNRNYGGKFLLSGLSLKEEGGDSEIKYFASYPEEEDDFNQSIQPSTGNDLVGEFGKSVSTYGPYYVIGSPSSVGKTGEQTGRVYIYKRNPNIKPFDDLAWNGITNKESPSSTIFTIDPRDYNLTINSGARFGESVSMWGNYLLIGAPGEKNYPELRNSGSVYVFQRYYSNDNKWEFLGQIRAPDYSANSEFGKKIVHYMNDFIITSNNSFYYFSGGKLENKWPFGYHDDLVVVGGYTQKQGEMMDYSSLVVPPGEEYSITYPDYTDEIMPYIQEVDDLKAKAFSFLSSASSDGAPGNAFSQYQNFTNQAAQKTITLNEKINEINSRNPGWTYVGVAGYLRLDGKIKANGNPFFGDFRNKAPDESGFNFGKELFFFLKQRFGGVGTKAADSQSINYPNFHDTHMGDGDSECNDPVGVCNPASYFNRGTVGSIGYLNGFGGVGGSLNSNQICVSCECRDRRDSGEKLGSYGGKPGKHGGAIYIQADSVAGSGQIDLSGEKGENSSQGIPATYANHGHVVAIDRNDHDGLRWCWSCAIQRGLPADKCDDGDDPGAVRIGNEIFIGPSGCGGGGAGGSGGSAFIDFKQGISVSSGWSFNVSPGLGGDPCQQDNFILNSSGSNGATGLKRECNLSKNECD